MNRVRIVVTELTRKLSSLLGTVRCDDVSLEVRRRKARAASIKAPCADPGGYPIARLNDLLAGLPHLQPDDAQAFLDELDALDKAVGAHRDRWDV